MTALLRLGLLALIASLASCSRSADPVTHATRSVELRVDGMTCAGCEKTVCSAVQSVAGVESCVADYLAGRVTVVYEPAKTSDAALTAAIRSAGFEVP